MYTKPGRPSNGAEFSCEDWASLNVCVRLPTEMEAQIEGHPGINMAQSPLLHS